MLIIGEVVIFFIGGSLEDRFNDFMLLHKGRTANWCWLHR